MATTRTRRISPQQQAQKVRSSAYARGEPSSAESEMRIGNGAFASLSCILATIMWHIIEASMEGMEVKSRRWKESFHRRYRSCHGSLRGSYGSFHGASYAIHKQPLISEGRK